MRHAVEAPEDPAEPSGEESRDSPIPRPPGVPKEKSGVIEVYNVERLLCAEDCERSFRRRHELLKTANFHGII